MSDSPNKPVVIVLGGIASHVCLIEKLKEQGCETVLIDYLDNPPAKAYADRFIQDSCLDPDKVLSIAQQFNATCIATSHLDRTLPVAALVSERMGLTFYLTHQQAIALTDKESMKRMFGEAKVPTSSYHIVDESNGKELDSMSYPVVCKPVDGTGSQGLAIIHNQRDVQGFLKSAFQASESKKVVVEEFIEGPEYSIDICVKDGKSNVLAFRRRDKVYLDEGSNLACHGALLVRDISDCLREEMRGISQGIVDVLKLENTPLMIQAILQKNGHFSVIEIAARLSGGITSRYLPQATGVDLLQFSIACQLGLDYDLQRCEDGSTYGVKLLYGKAGAIAQIGGFEACKAEGLIEHFHLLRAVGDVLPADVSTKSRFAEIVVRGTSAEEINQKLERVFQRVTLQGDNMQNLLLDDTEWQDLN